MIPDIPGRRVASWSELKDKGDFCVVDPGAADFGTSQTIIAFICPCCGDKSFVPLKPSDPQGWDFDGNRDRPTVSPSIYFNMNHPEARCRWHGFITAGVFKTV